MESVLKDPDAKLDYGFDWSSWLATGETIMASAWTIPTGLTKVSSSFDDTGTSVWLSGGTLGTDYDIINHITTSAGREEDRTIRIKVRAR